MAGPIKPNWTLIWTAVGALAAVLAVGFVGYQQLFQAAPNLASVPSGASARSDVLKVAIYTHKYRHAGSELDVMVDEWDEKLTQPLIAELKARSFSAQQIADVANSIKSILKAYYRGPLDRFESGIRWATTWHDVYIRNDGDEPLSGVFFRFPRAEYWLNREGRVTRVPDRIEIGELEQKSKLRLVFWGDTHSDRWPFVGHARGVGTVRFEKGAADDWE